MSAERNGEPTRHAVDVPGPRERAEVSLADIVAYLRSAPGWRELPAGEDDDWIDGPGAWLRFRHVNHDADRDGLGLSIENDGRWAQMHYRPGYAVANIARAERREPWQVLRDIVKVQEAGTR